MNYGVLSFAHSQCNNISTMNYGVFEAFSQLSLGQNIIKIPTIKLTPS
jgi:hypothetical protein